MFRCPTSSRFLLTIAVLFAAIGFVSAQQSSLSSGAPTIPDVVLLEFTMPGCIPCAQVAPLVSELTAAGYPVRQIDITRQPEMAAHFAVDAAPTFLMLVNGTVVDRLCSGGDPAVLRPRVLRMFQVAREHFALSIPQGARDSTPAISPSPEPTTSPGMPLSTVLSPQPVALQSTTAPQMSPLQPPQVASPPPFSLQRSSVRIRVDDATGHSWGTGTIIDTRSGQALILTCGHIFRDSNGQGPIEVHLFGEYSEMKTAGRYITHDLDADLALVAITPPCPVEARPIIGENAAYAVGDVVSSVGCDGGAAPTLREHRIMSLDRIGTGPDNKFPFRYIQVSGAPVSGRSGGGLFAADGSLIGVCVTADPRMNDGHFVPPHIIRRHLDQLNMSTVYKAPSLRDTSPATTAPHTTLAAVQPAIADAFTPEQTITRSIDRQTMSARTPNAPALALPLQSVGMSDLERATLEEITKRQQEGNEVIVIIHPRRNVNDPQNRSEIITLHDASADFLEQLAQNAPLPIAPEPVSTDSRGEENRFSANSRVLLTSPSKSTPLPVTQVSPRF